MIPHYPKALSLLLCCLPLTALPLAPGSGGITNDDCESAQPITCGTTVSGTTEGALPDAPPDCGTTITAPGVWYSFVGTGGTVVLSTCSDPGYDTKINVYTGACDDLTCIGGNDDGPFGCFPGSEVILEVEEGVTYLVLVQGYNGEQGAFELEFSCPTCLAPTDITVSPGDTLAYVYWNTGNTSSSFQIEYGAPGFTPGTGSVYTGMVGQDGPPAVVPGLSLDTPYELYISESCGVGDVSDVRGPIGFTTLAEPVAENAFCPGALPIACGGTLTGNTSNGIYAPAPWCGSANVTSSGLWYTFTGDGSAVTLSTCGTAEYDTKISVFSGACGALNCAGGNDDGVDCAGFTSQVTVPTENGVQYRVLVHGYEETSGTFTLAMTCEEPCAPAVPNDDCANATPLVPQAFGNCVPLTGTNVCANTAVQANPPCDPYAPIQDVWYVLNTGPSTDHTVTVATVSAGPVGVALYSGCGTGFVECFDPSEGPIVLNGLTADTDYYIQVWNGGGADAGTFTICDEASVLVGVADARSGGLRAWPVPADDILTVEGLAIGSPLTLVDAQGRVVRTLRVESSTRQQVDVTGIAAGAYLLRQEGREPVALPVIIR